MGKLAKVIIFFFIASDIFLYFWIILHGKTIAIFQPTGITGIEERWIITFVALLGLSIVVPTIIIAYIVLWKYRANNTKAKYTPEWDNSKPISIGLFAFLCVVTGVLFYFDWKSAHDLSPFKPIASSKQITIQVVAMRWKWLFIYPDYGIASINYFRFPVKAALNFHITADAPMNGFWIPQLGGQVYAMNGMSMPFHLLAEKTGRFSGKSSNISGDGFSGMTFIAEATSQEDFDAWISEVKSTNKTLNKKSYEHLAKPSQDNKPTFYTLGDTDIYNSIISKYMTPSQMHSEKNTDMNMNMQ